MEKSRIRTPVVAGQFYQAEDLALKRQIEGLLGDALEKKDQPKVDVIACVLPHAGYMYSGHVAARTVARINIKEKVIMLGPNHTGYGAPFSLMSEGIWQTPLGKIEIDSVLAKKILNQSQHLEDDIEAHLDEHSLEVQLPFLQYFKADFQIVPIIVFAEKLKILQRIGQDIASAIIEANLKSSVMIIASSDLTHYEPQAQAVKKDQEAINAILELNEEALTQKVEKLNISMCGLAPVTVMLAAAKSLGAKSAELIKYQTSGDIIGDKSSVVGYAGITIN